MFELIPAVDVAGGRVVRLTQGEADRVTVYGDDPVEAARRWVDEGASALHLVDLDAAFGRGGIPFTVVEAIVRLGVAVEVGGGIRSAGAAARLVEAGATRVVVGSVLGDPDALADMVTTVGATRVAASIDIREGKLKVQGWVQTLTASADTVAELLRAVGIRRVIVTAVERDGTGRGPDIALTAEWVARGFSVYAAGGIARAEDLAALRASGARGAILGRALYDGRLSLEEGRKAVC